MNTKMKYAFLTFAMLLILGASAAFVPPVRAQVNKVIALFTSSSAKLEPNAPVPGYLAEFNSGPISVSVQAGMNTSDKTVEVYQNGDQYLILTKTDKSNGAALPDGTPVAVNGQPGVLNTDQSGTYNPAPDGQSGNGQPVIQYTNANKLTWFDGDTLVEMVSNLSVDDMQKIAEELFPSK